MPSNHKKGGGGMSTRRAVVYTVLAFAVLFTFQVLWTHDRLDQLRQLGRRHSLRRTLGGRGGGRLEPGGHRLDRLALGGDGSGAGVGGTAGTRRGGLEQQQQQQQAALAAEQQQQQGGQQQQQAAQLAARGEGVAGGSGPPLPDPALVVFAFNRSDYLNQTLHSLLGLRGLERFTVYLSQDGDEPSVAAVVRELQPRLEQAAKGFAFWQKAPRVPELGAGQPGHAWLAQHYKWGLDKVFHAAPQQQRQQGGAAAGAAGAAAGAEGAQGRGQGHSHVVIVEDDMLFSPDFLLYFEATAPLLDADPTLWCVSTWNDNGFTTGHSWDVRRLFRTSYFPGLGWLMKRELWLELGPKWPKDHWDHWMRDEEVSRGRECVCPEVNRNKNIGEVGANMNKQAFKRFLKTMAWNADQEVVDYGDLSYLLQPAYTQALQAELAGAQPYQVSWRRDAPQPEAGKSYLVAYTMEQFMRVSLRLKLWPYPRGHHQHVAVIPWRGARFLVADRRFCPLLPKDMQLPPSAGMEPVAAERWQSCHDACSGRGMACSAKDFWWLNSCSVMRKHFPCENGCTIELGPDVPAYVADPAQTLHKYCLITQKLSRCASKHAATARLCPCVPVPEEEEEKTLRRLAAAADQRQQRQRQQETPFSSSQSSSLGTGQYML